MDVGKLSYYWAGEGIPRLRYYDDGSTIDDVTDGCVKELVQRSMVISERDKVTSRYKTCQLNDMMREVCLLKANEENFVHILEPRSVTSHAKSQSLCESRRLVVLMSDPEFDMERDLKNPKLRSLLFMGLYWRPKPIASGFSRLTFMRVLDLTGAQFKGRKVPFSIGRLIHLRYLSLFESNASHLPSSMSNLKLLLYLNLDFFEPFPEINSTITQIDVFNMFIEMPELRYLCLPKKMQEKTKVDLGHLTNLETLKNFSTEHSSVTDFHRMTRLKELFVIINGRGCTMEILLSSLGELRNMENLTIRDDTNLPGYFSLESIHLKYFPSHLTTISLDNCGLVEDPMPILEKMLHLNVVTLSNEAFKAQRMVCSSGGFPQLRKLTLEKLYWTNEWIVKKGSMPILHALVLDHCSFEELPEGLRFITSLKQMKIYLDNKYCGQGFYVGGKDYYKVQHIPSYNIICDTSYSEEGEGIYQDEADFWRTFSCQPEWVRNLET